MSSKSINLLLTALLAFVPTASISAEEAHWRIVNFWSEWCAPCRIEIPEFNLLSKELASSEVRIVGVNFDEDPRDITLEIAEELGIEFPVLTQEEVDALALRPPDVMPTTYILTPSNEVAAKLVGMQSRDSLLEEFAKLGLDLELN